MKYLPIFLALLPTIAPASAERCQNLFLTLSCQYEYNFTDGTTGVGSSNTGRIEDRQLEPFDPANCVASSVLYTPVGKLVAEYFEVSNTLSVWKESPDKQFQWLAQDVDMTSGGFKTSFPGEHPEVKSFTLSCLVDTNQD